MTNKLPCRLRAALVVAGVLWFLQWRWRKLEPHFHTAAAHPPAFRYRIRQPHDHAPDDAASADPRGAPGTPSAPAAESGSPAAPGAPGAGPGSPGPGSPGPGPGQDLVAQDLGRPRDRTGRTAVTERPDRSAGPGGPPSPKGPGGPPSAGPGGPPSPKGPGGPPSAGPGGPPSPKGPDRQAGRRTSQADRTGHGRAACRRSRPAAAASRIRRCPADCRADRAPAPRSTSSFRRPGRCARHGS